MIVLDASAVVELLTDGGDLAERVAQALAPDSDWMCPEHMPLETVSALRGLWLGGQSTRSEFDARVSALSQIELTTVPTLPMLMRVAQLAANATTYGAAYLAAAEHLDVPLVTVDGKLTRVPGVRAEIRLITREGSSGADR